MTRWLEPALLDVATEVRRAFERRSISLNLLAELYARYNTAVNPAAFVAEASRLYPTGCCGLATLYVRHRLGNGALVWGRYRDEPHTFLLSRSGLVVDVTADQFGGPPVYVGPKVKPWSIGDDPGFRAAGPFGVYSDIGAMEVGRFVFDETNGWDGQAAAGDHVFGDGVTHLLYDVPGHDSDGRGSLNRHARSSARAVAGGSGRRRGAALSRRSP